MRKVEAGDERVSANANEPPWKAQHERLGVGVPYRYDPTFLESILTGKSCQVPADFFVRIADVLDLGAVERDALVRSRAFGIGRWNWSRSRESRPGEQAQSKTG